MMHMEELLASLQADYPNLKFRAGYKFKFRPPRTIYYESPDAVGLKSSAYNNCRLQLLHEVGHALLGHRDFFTDLERVKMECAAWQKAEELCAKYQIEYDDDFAEAELDSYRDWLHQRSTCKACGLTCYQTTDGEYHCPMCEM